MSIADATNMDIWSQLKRYFVQVSATTTLRSEEVDEQRCHYQPSITASEPAKEMRKFKTVFANQPVPGYLEGIKGWIAPMNQALAILAHTRGVRAQPCWREQQPHRIFENTVLLLDNVDGKILLDCCTNCRWVGDCQRRCTAMPYRPPNIDIPRFPSKFRYRSVVLEFSPETIRQFSPWEMACWFYHNAPSEHKASQSPNVTVLKVLNKSTQANLSSLMALASRYNLQARGIPPLVDEANFPYVSEGEPRSQDHHLDTSRVIGDLYRLFLRVEQSYRSLELRVRASGAPSGTQLFGISDCGICQEPYGDVSHTLIHAPCRHAFGAACYVQWLYGQASMQATPSCPACRTPVKILQAVPLKAEWIDSEITKFRIGMFYENYSDIETKRNQLDKLIRENSTPQFQDSRKQAARLSEILDRYWFSESSEAARRASDEAWNLSCDMATLFQDNDGSAPKATKRFLKALMSRASHISDADKTISELLDVFKVLMSIIDKPGLEWLEDDIDREIREKKERRRQKRTKGTAKKAAKE